MTARSLGSAAVIGSTLVVGGVLVVVAAVGCNDDYALAPTFCDDWCRATTLPRCEQEPSECVSDCELTRASADCSSLQEELLSCYEDTKREDFVCAGGGFGAETRVQRRRCEAERDALFECEAPGIGVCLSFCRDIQEDQLEAIVDSAPGPVQMPSTMTDAGASATCPTIGQPCEELCWTLFSFTSEGLGAAGLTQEEVSNGAEAESTALCLQSVLLGCFAEGMPGFPGQPAEVTVSSADDDEPPTVDELIAQCLEEAIPFEND